MSAIAQVPEGLKPSECERGSGLNPPVPYIPETCDDSEKRKATTIKFALANGVETRSEVWDGVGTKEQFLCHVQKIWSALEGVGLMKELDDAEEKLRTVRAGLKNNRTKRELTREQLGEAVLEEDKQRLRDELAPLETAVTEGKALVDAV